MTSVACFDADYNYMDQYPVLQIEEGNLLDAKVQSSNTIAQVTGWGSRRTEALVTLLSLLRVETPAFLKYTAGLDDESSVLLANYMGDLGSLGVCGVPLSALPTLLPGSTPPNWPAWLLSTHAVIAVCRVLQASLDELRESLDDNSLEPHAKTEIIIGTVSEYACATGENYKFPLWLNDTIQEKVLRKISLLATEDT